MQRLLAVALLLVACQPLEPIREPRIPDRGTRMKVGLLTPGSVNDNGWNAIAYEGLLRIQTELGAEISHQETRTPAEFEFQDARAEGRLGRKEGIVSVV